MEASIAAGRAGNGRWWRREGLRRCWSRRSDRPPGRPRIDSDVRALIRRMAAENRLWGAPRIHSELLTLGIGVSERTVSRYLANTLSVQSRRQHRRTAATSCASRTAKRTCACHSESSRSIGETHANDVMSHSSVEPSRCRRDESRSMIQRVFATPPIRRAPRSCP